MKKLTSLLVLVFLFTILSCNNKVEEAPETTPEPAFDLSTAKAEIIDANKAFAATFPASDSVAIANLYTANAKVMVHGAPTISGRDNIQSLFGGFMKSGVNKVDLKTIEVWGNENYVTEEGEFSIFVDDNMVDQGKYVVLWKNEDGKWYLHRDIFNSSMPAE